MLLCFKLVQYVTSVAVVRAQAICLMERLAHLGPGARAVATTSHLEVGGSSAVAAIDRLSNWLTREDRGSVAHSSNNFLSVFCKYFLFFPLCTTWFKRINGNPANFFDPFPSQVTTSRCNIAIVLISPRSEPGGFLFKKKLVLWCVVDHPYSTIVTNTGGNCCAVGVQHTTGKQLGQGRG